MNAIRREANEVFFGVERGGGGEAELRGVLTVVEPLETTAGDV